MGKLRASYAIVPSSLTTSATAASVAKPPTPPKENQVAGGGCLQSGSVFYLIFFCLSHCVKELQVAFARCHEASVKQRTRGFKGRILLPLRDGEQFGQSGNACLRDSCATMQPSQLAPSSPSSPFQPSCVDAGVAPAAPQWLPAGGHTEPFYWMEFTVHFICVELSQTSISFYFG